MEQGNRRYVSVTDTAKLLRQSLRSAFPGVKFSVKSRKYAGGASIDVSWTDGPTADEVDGIAQLYRGATFDGMTDSKSFHDAILAGPDGMPEVVHFGAHFVFTHRSFSPELVAAAAAFIASQGRQGRLTYPEQCRYCGGSMFADSSCYAVRGARGYRDFVCSPECGAKVELRYGHVRPSRRAAVSS